jgi:hypothetical protein
MNKKLYILFENRAAGETFIREVEENSNWTYQELGGAHATNIFESNSLEEVKSYLRELKEATTQYYVFWDNQYDEYYIRTISCNSGSIQDNKPTHNSKVLRVFDTYEEAEAYIEKFEEA